MKTYSNLKPDQQLIYDSLMQRFIDSDWDQGDFCIAMGTLLNMLKRGNIKG